MHQAIPYKSIKLPTGGGGGGGGTATTTASSHPLTLGTLHLISRISGVGGGGCESKLDTQQKSNHEIKRVVLQNPVIVIGRQGCCMVHVVKRLLLSLGVNPAVHELDNEDDRAEQKAAEELGETNLQFPAVFIGGRLFGGLERVMATHITGELTPILKQAGALWL